MTGFKMTKFGLAEDPRGAQVKWTFKGRTYLADVVGIYRNEVSGCTFLKTRHFNGEDAPDVPVLDVEVLGWSSAAHWN